jgi:isoleucyl-tRNA synthetase
MVAKVDEAYNDYEPTKAAREIQSFVIDDLSNWYVRLNRKRFWKGQYNEDKISAYQTLYTCLLKVAQLGSPIAPFYMDQLFSDLNSVSNQIKKESIHLTDFPKVEEQLINEELESKMELAQKISSLIHSLRKKEMIKVRQPLSRLLIPVLNDKTKSYISDVKELILGEVNVKSIEFIDDTSGILIKKIKPNFKKLGREHGSKMKEISQAIAKLEQEDINSIEKNNILSLDLNDSSISLTLEDVEISSEDIPGWLVANDGGLTVALDVTITEELKQEGLARDMVNRIQNLRKDMGLDVQDKILINIGSLSNEVKVSLEKNEAYICEETQAKTLSITHELADGTLMDMEEFDIRVKLEVVK